MSDAGKTLWNIAQSLPAPGTESSAQGVVEIVGADLDAMLAFHEPPGFRVERRTGPFAAINGYGMRIFVAGNAAAPRNNRWSNIRIVVDDVDLIWECVNAIGLPVVHGIADRRYGLRDFVIGDPTGFEIRFAQVIGNQAQ